jgi:neutral ceramidase
MRVGFGIADITADVGKPVGSLRQRVMTGIHDPLLAVACVIDDGKRAVALVGVDAGAVMRATVLEARDQIGQATGIRGDDVMVSASHTHQGGPSLTTFNAIADPVYARKMSDGIASAVTKAWESRRTAEIGFGSGRAAGIAFNRRFVMRDGTQATHPGKLHPQIVRPAGPVDERVNVLAARDSDGKIVGAIVNFGCHCTVTEMGTTYSADYVYYLREHVKRLVGDVPVVFMLGACGDVTQCDAMRAIDEHGHPWADLMSATLAAEVGRTISALKWEKELPVRAASERVNLPVRQEDGRERPRIGLGSGAEWAAIFEREKPHIEKLRRETPIVDCEIQAIGIGELGIVSSGAELFCEPAMEIGALSPTKATWVVTLANEYVGYVPTANAYWAGGYEVQTARSSYLGPQAAQRIVEGSLRALTRL